LLSIRYFSEANILLLFSGFRKQSKPTDGFVRVSKHGSERQGNRAVRRNNTWRFGKRPNWSILHYQQASHN
jgi:hypothetical protein